MAGKNTPPTAKDVSMFVPALDFDQSLKFYTRLGWKLNWKTDDNTLAELELADKRFLLQNFYVKLWAENFVLHITVEDATAWYNHVETILQEEDFANARVNTPKREAHGALTTPVWDPSGVLIYFSQPD